MNRILKIFLGIGAVIAVIIILFVIWASIYLPSNYWRTSSLIKHMSDSKNNWRSKWYDAMAIKVKGVAAEKEAFYEMLMVEPPFFDVIPGVLQA